MKLKLICSILFSFLLAAVKAQDEITFTSSNGTTVNVTVLSKNADEGRNNSVYLGFFGPEGVNSLGFSTYKPTKYYINALGGFTGGMVDGSFFLTSKLKESSISNSLKAEGNITYVGKIPVEKRTSFGLHGGAGYTDYSFQGSNTSNSYSTMSAFGGISLLKAKHLQIVIDENVRRGARNGTLIMRLNADGIFYFGQKSIKGNAVNPSGDSSLSVLTRNIGFRVYVDGKATVWGRKGRLSLNYMLGIGQNSMRKNRLPAIGGLGFGYNF